MSATLWTPTAKKSVEAVPLSHMQLLSNFAATWGRVDGPRWGIHCSRCGGDVQASNGTTDRVLKVACECQEFYCDPHTLGV